VTATSSDVQLDLETLADARGVPTPPAAALRILEIRSDPNSVVRDLAKAVESDPALVTKILSMANSAYYRRGDEVVSVERAIATIGRSSVMTIALAFSVASSVPADGVVGGVSMSTYWSHSILTAGASRALAGELGPGVSDEAFLVGLISGMGRVMLALAAEDHYAPIATANDGWPSLETERTALGFSSANASASLLRSWNMPTVFADAIDAIEDPSAADDEETRLLASITALAVTIADFYLNDGDADDLRNITTQATANGLSGDALDRVLDGVQANASEIAAQLNLSISAVEYSATIARARSQLVEQVLQTDEMWHQERQRREELERTQATYEAEARIDPLTGLGNRRAFDEQLAMHLQIRLEAKTKLHKPMGIVMIDLDHFKSVNDTYGHDVGDEVLRKLAAAVTPITRDEETIARYGGEEFVLFAPAATVEELTKAGERLRASIEAIQLPLSNGETLRVTASFGIATLWQPVSEQDGAKLLKAADEALYEAKESGRNRVVVSAVDLG